MISGNRKRFSCGHRGRGSYCHRCEQATKLEELAAAKKSHMTYKKAEKPKKWSVEEMLEEAKRLRNQGRR